MTRPTPCCQQPLTLPFTLARSLRYNELGTDGWCAIFAALRDNKDNKIESWDLFDQGIHNEIAKVLAEYVSVSTAITSLKYVAQHFAVSSLGPLYSFP